MAVSGGPDVVSDGLVLALDAGNVKSYPQSGTVWRDISGNGNNGTLTNGPIFDSANNGSIVFDGVDDYTSSFPTQLSDNNSKTINVWFKVNTTVRTGLCGTRNIIALVGTGWVFTVNRTTPGNLTYYHTGGSIAELSAGIVTNTWYNASVTYNLTTATTTLYLNGNILGTPFTSFTTITTSTFNGIIGAEQENLADKLVGNISQIQIYNRALTAQEILQNFNSTRSRFGV